MSMVMAMVMVTTTMYVGVDDDDDDYDEHAYLGIFCRAACCVASTFQVTLCSIVLCSPREHHTDCKLKAPGAARSGYGWLRGTLRMPWEVYIRRSAIVSGKAQNK